MKRNIVIYRDDGVGEFGLACLEKFFCDDDVRLVSAEEVKAGQVFAAADLFVMPGGADLPYCRKLNGAGNDNIRAFVEDGGTYLGLCAGAYYGAAALEFHKGRADEISGPRELALVDAVAYGSLPGLVPFYDLTLHSAAVVAIDIPGAGDASIFYHGGPSFRLRGDAAVRAVYSGLDSRPPAIVEGRVGKGRAILCGVHAEMSPEYLADYPVSDPAERAALAKILAAFDRKASAGPHDVLRALLAQGSRP